MSHKELIVKEYGGDLPNENSNLAMGLIDRQRISNTTDTLDFVRNARSIEEAEDFIEEVMDEIPDSPWLTTGPAIDIAKTHKRNEVIKTKRGIGIYQWRKVK